MASPQALQYNSFLKPHTDATDCHGSFYFPISHFKHYSVTVTVLQFLKKQNRTWILLQLKNGTGTCFLVSDLVTK